MDHEVANKTHAIERYLLGEMPTSERDAFEEHFFDCAECADEIRTASVLMHDMKTTLRDFRAAPKSSPTGWLSWLKVPVLVPTFAALALLAVVGYQNLGVMPDLEAPRSISAALILDGTTRGDLPELRVGDALLFKIAPEAAAGGKVYVEVDKASGGKVRGGEVAAPPAGQALSIFFPGSLGAGRYELVVRENPGGRELARSGFDVVKK